MREGIQGLTPADLRRKTLIGHVVSDKMDKTVVVAVETLYRHPLYRKIVKRTKRFLAHDEHEVCQVGDRVRIVETRPLSRRKRWRVVEIISHDLLAGVEPVAGEEEFVELAHVLQAEGETSADEETTDAAGEPGDEQAATAAVEVRE